MHIKMVVFLILLFFHEISCNSDAKRLYDDVLRKNGYNKMVRPVGNNSDTLTVNIGLMLSQLLDIDEKNQIMSTNVWLKQEWYDYKLKWDPALYGGIDKLYVPSDEIWVPDIVLYNNADGNYVVTLMTKAKIYSSGCVIWEPLVIYKSSCNIDVEFFPFDMQTCRMKFGVWTYDGYMVDMKHAARANVDGEVALDDGIDMSRYTPSSEWDVLDVPARRNIKYYPCCPEPFPDVTFSVTLRRKPLFYTVILIAPCLSISVLTGFVFYLPSDSKKKMTMCISIFVALTVFFLLVSDLMPPTSLVIPLIGKYLLFTMTLVTLSIMITVVVLNVHCREPNTHTMPPWVRKVFLEILPNLVLLKRPKRRRLYNRRCNENNGAAISLPVGTQVASRHTKGEGSFLLSADLDQGFKLCTYSAEVYKSMDNVKFIADRMEAEDREKQMKEDWKFVAMVIDRIFLWIFTLACLGGAFGIILRAPSLYDSRVPIEAQPYNATNFVSCMKQN